MNNEILVLVLTASSLGFIHTILGIDHYVPFIAISKSLNWSRTKTLLITAISGVGHVLSTVLIGLIGIAIGLSLSVFESIENVRGEIAGWLLLFFGIAYTIFGIFRSKKKHSHTHFHPSINQIHSHQHSHDDTEHKHLHETPTKVTAWILFLILVFGPCESLIPILMIPAAQHSVLGLILVTLVFGFTTVITMLLMVYLGTLGINLIPIRKAEKHIHTLAGLAILICGIGVQFLGL